MFTHDYGFRTLGCVDFWTWHVVFLNSDFALSRCICVCGMFEFRACGDYVIWTVGFLDSGFLDVVFSKLRCLNMLTYGFLGLDSWMFNLWIRGYWVWISGFLMSGLSGLWTSGS